MTIFETILTVYGVLNFIAFILGIDAYDYRFKLKIGQILFPAYFLGYAFMALINIEL